AKVFGWAFAGWGIGLYWWAGILYAYQVYKLVKSTERRPGAPGCAPRRGERSAAPGAHDAAAVPDHAALAGRRLRARRGAQTGLRRRGSAPPLAASYGGRGAARLRVAGHRRGGTDLAQRLGRQRQPGRPD